MTLPSIDPYAWFLGTPEDRNLGGRVMLMWADSVLPYSVDPPTVPGWWDQPGTDTGQFPSWIRNFAANDGTGAKNFPNDREGDPEDNRFFNCVIPYMLGLKDSVTAPKRLKDYHELVPGGKAQLNESDGPGAGERWPFRAEDQHALHFLEFYMDEFIDPATTGLIVALPVRDVMNFIGNPEDSNLFPRPDVPVGWVSIRAFVKGALTKAKSLGIAILGWYLIDEPDFLLFNYWVTAANVAFLRREVRQAEYEWRMASPGGVANDSKFLAIPLSPQGEVERQAWLRPCVLTFSRDFGEEFPGVPPPGVVRRETPGEYAAVGAADLYLFDWYPYRRTLEQVEADWGGGICPGADPNFSDLPRFTFDDGPAPMTPKVSLLRFRQLRRLLNPSGNPDKPDLLPGDPGYFAVGLWSQAGGNTRASDLLDGSPAREPASLPRPDQTELGGEGCDAPEPSFSRLKRMPTEDEIRYYMWAGLFDLSEGFACFSQTGIADNTLVQRFVAAAGELDYFQSLRVKRIPKSEIYVPRHLRSLIQADADFPKFSPVFWWVRFVETPGRLQGIDPIGLMEWLIVLNRESTELSVQFDVSQTGFPSGDWVLQEWKFLDRIDSSIILINRGTSPNVSFNVPPFRMRLFQSRRHKPASDPPFP